MYQPTTAGEMHNSVDISTTSSDRAMLHFLNIMPGTNESLSHASDHTSNCWKSTFFCSLIDHPCFLSTARKLSSLVLSESTYIEKVVFYSFGD